MGKKVLSIKLVNYSSWQLYYFLLSAVLAHVLLLILLQIKILFYVVIKVNASNKKALFGNGCGSVVEQSLPSPEVRGSNPVIGKIY